MMKRKQKHIAIPYTFLAYHPNDQREPEQSILRQHEHKAENGEHPKTKATAVFYILKAKASYQKVNNTRSYVNLVLYHG